MKRQILAAAVVLPILASVAPAQAAKRPPARKPVCFQIKDAPNDATGNGTGAFDTPNDPSSDILSADIASDATWVTAVVRASSVAENATNSPSGRAYDVSFLAHNKVITLRALVSSTGEKYFGGLGQGRVDTVKNEVWIHVKIADLGIPLKPNDKLTQLRATTSRWVGTTDASLGGVDNAVGPAAYVAGWPTCLPKVGP